MVVAQGETVLEVLRQFPVRARLGLVGGAGLLVGAGVPVAGDVEFVQLLPCQEPTVLHALGHAPHHRVPQP